MSTLGDVVQNILSITPQPDKEALIRSKINQVIKYLGGTGDYWKALKEVTITSVDGVDATSYLQAIELLPDFRTLFYVKYPENISTTPINTYSAQTALELQKCGKLVNAAYPSGRYLRIKHETLTPEFQLGYYSYTDDFALDGSQDANTNWILESIPGLVEDLVSAYILNLIGDNEDSGRITQFATSMQLPYLRAQIYGAIER